MPSHDLSVIVASYRTAQVTLDCVRSALADAARSKYSIEVIVVDDASPDNTVDLLAVEVPDATVLVNPVNVHYAKTNNRGLRECDGRYAMLLNSDTIIHEGCFDILIDYLDANPGVGAAGPKLVNPDGSVQYCIRSFPGVGVMFFQALNLQKLWPNNPITNRYYHLDLDYGATHTVNSLGTTAFVVRREVWESGVMLDEEFKIAFVDLAYCAAMGTAGYPISYVGEAVVTHLGSQSINLSSTDEVNARADGLRLLYDKYLAGRDPKWKRPIVRAGIKAWGVLRRIEHRLSKDKRVITGPGAPRRDSTAR